MRWRSIPRVFQELAAKPLLRPPINTPYNVENFAPVMAHFVRFTVLATVNGNEPCLDALEINSADRSANLTQVARRTLSSVHPQLGHWNDGTYGNGWCWVSKEPGKGWAQVELPAPLTMYLLQE